MATDGIQLDLAMLSVEETIAELGNPTSEYAEGGITDLYYAAGDYTLNVSFDYTELESPGLPPEVSFAIMRHAPEF